MHHESTSLVRVKNYVLIFGNECFAGGDLVLHDESNICPSDYLELMLEARDEAKLVYHYTLLQLHDESDVCPSDYLELRPTARHEVKHVRHCTLSELQDESDICPSGYLEYPWWSC